MSEMTKTDFCILRLQEQIDELQRSTEQLKNFVTAVSLKLDMTMDRLQFEQTGTAKSKLHLVGKEQPLDAA